MGAEASANKEPELFYEEERWIWRKGIDKLNNLLDVEADFLGAIAGQFCDAYIRYVIVNLFSVNM